MISANLYEIYNKMCVIFAFSFRFPPPHPGPAQDYIIHPEIRLILPERRLNNIQVRLKAEYSLNTRTLPERWHHGPAAISGGRKSQSATLPVLMQTAGIGRITVEEG